MNGPGVRHRHPPRRSGTIVLAGLLISVGTAWFLAPLWLVPTGLRAWDRHPDPGVRATARAAYEAAWIHNDNPLGRLLFPAARVTAVARDPGHCREGEPGGREPHADYRAEVRFHSWFGIPGPLLRSRCGGWIW